MPQAPNTPRPPTPQSPRPQAGGANAALNAVQIDPVKLLRKYFWVLAFTGAVALFVGVVTHFVLIRVAPSYQSKALFEVVSAKKSIEAPRGTQGVNNNELERFMGTQSALMVHERVLENVVTHPQLQSKAPTFHREFFIAGAIDIKESIRDLQGRASARPLPKTSLIQLSVSYPDRNEATELLRLIRESYQRFMQNDVNVDSAGQLQTLRKLRDEAEQGILTFQERRDRVVRESDFDTLEDRTSEVGRTIARLTEESLDIGLQLEALQEQLAEQERQLTRDAGIEFGDDLVNAAEGNPRVANLRQQIDSLQTGLQTFRERGFKDQHRDVQQIHASIAATRQRLEQTRSEVLLQLFMGQVETNRRFIAQLEAQQSQLQTQLDETRIKRNELVRLSKQVDEINREVISLTERKNGYEASLDNLIALDNSKGNIRIKLAQQERVPDGRAFPRITVIVPLVFLLICGSVGGLILLREVLDQRVKSPADIAMIPKTRVLGMLPIASEETTGVGQVETVFRDFPRGVLAEHVRQIRSVVLKRMAKAGHTSVVVVPASPGSGATSLACNVALSAAATHTRTLIIDGNFRRPALHAVFDLRDGPGLADALSAATPFDQAIQPSGSSDLDVMTVGSAESRQYELLASPRFGELIAKASAAYDLVIVDAPPAVVSGDGVMMAQRCDASILVARALNEKRGMIARLRNELGETRAELLGVLVNAVRAAAGGYMRDNIRMVKKYQSGGAVGGSIDRDAAKRKLATAAAGDDD